MKENRKRGQGPRIPFKDVLLMTSLPLTCSVASQRQHGLRPWPVGDIADPISTGGVNHRRLKSCFWCSLALAFSRQPEVRGSQPVYLKNASDKSKTFVPSMSIGLEFNDPMDEHVQSS